MLWYGWTVAIAVILAVERMVTMIAIVAVGAYLSDDRYRRWVHYC